MDSSSIRLTYAALVCLDLAWGTVLTLLNYRRVMARSGRLPAALLGQVSDEEHRKASRYSLARMRLGFVSGPVVTLLMLAAVLSGFFGLLDHTIAGAIHGEYLRGAAFMGAFALLLALLSLPFSLYSTFVLEKRFGFNTTKPLTWLLDALKGAALSIVLGLPLLLLLFLFMDGTGRLWWLWAFALFTVVNVIISLLYPLVIAPLFNKFSPLPEGSLSERIRGMADRLGFRMSGIFVMDGSRRSRHSNAYFTGFGRLKRVVLFDTLVSQMSEEEILAVLAHEIGHEKKRHVIKGMILSTLLSLLGFWLLSLVQSWGPVYPAFGFTAPSKEALLLIVSLASGPCTFFLTPLFSAWSRRHEYEADRFSAAAAGAKEMGSALVKLNRENASNLTPHPLYSFWYYSHPTVLERLSAIGWSAKDGGDRPGDVS